MTSKNPNDYQFSACHSGNNVQVTGNYTGTEVENIKIEIGHNNPGWQVVDSVELTIGPGHPVDLPYEFVPPPSNANVTHVRVYEKVDGTYQQIFMSSVASVCPGEGGVG